MQFIDLWVPPHLSQSKIGSTSSKRAFGLAPAESVLLALRSPPVAGLALVSVAAGGLEIGGPEEISQS